MKPLTDQLKIQIEKLTVKFADSSGSLAYWEETVREQAAELVRLRKALNALEGKPETQFPDLLAPQLAPMTVLQTPQNGNDTIGPGAHIETVDGTDYVIEPGYELTTNSFGEISILPIGTKAIPMAEPTKPVPTTHGVVLPATNETLDRPEDML